MKHMVLTFHRAPRLLALAAGILALALIVFASPHTASAGNGYSLTMGSAVVPPDSAVAVELNLVAPEPGVGSYAIDIRFDDSVVDLASCQSLLGGCNKVYGAGLVRVVGIPFAPMVGEKTLATLVFEATGNGETTLDVQATNFFDSNGDDIARGTDIEDGSIQAHSPTGPDIQLGDATCDGHVNAIDAIRILSEKASPTGDPCLPYGDVNCDDLVDTTDVIALLMEFADLGAPSSC